MIFSLIYLALGIVLVGLRFPRQMATWAANEWPSLEWDANDTVMTVLFTAVAVLVWPLVVLMYLVRRLGQITVHQRLKDIHDSAKDNA